MLIVSIYGGQLKPGPSFMASARCLIMLILSINKRQDGCGENATPPGAPADTLDVASQLNGPMAACYRQSRGRPECHGGTGRVLPACPPRRAQWLRCPQPMPAAR